MLSKEQYKVSSKDMEGTTSHVMLMLSHLCLYKISLADLPS